MDANGECVSPLSCMLTCEFEDAVSLVKAALKLEGFGILSEIDVQKTLDEKIGHQIPPYLILGACNPHLASRAIAAEPRIGLFLPCNVLVAQVGADVEVTIQDPNMMVPITGNQKLEPIAIEARSRLAAVISELARRG